MTELTLTVEKPAAGGRMLARHDGQVVLVSGAIPGERIRARVERTSKSVLYAATVEVLEASPDRRAAAADWACGGNVFSHIQYDRQRRLKGDILRDALERIGRLPMREAPPVVGSPEQGYRMRARLHARAGRLGFFREGTHELCDAGATGQLLPATAEWLVQAQAAVINDRLDGLVGVELSENVSARERACHLLLEAGVDASPFACLAVRDLITGLSAERADRRGIEILAGAPFVTDRLHVHGKDTTLCLRRDVRAFFQGNRYLLDTLVRHVVGLIPDGPVVDLYAGVGLFGLSLAAAGCEQITLVEGDPISGASLTENAAPFGSRVRVERSSVEAFLTDPRFHHSARARERVQETSVGTLIVDPPRTGMSKVALAGIIRRAPFTIVYVSCDVATFARDTRTLLDAGYALEHVTGMDLFPNTAHVEAVGKFIRTPSQTLRTAP